MNTCTDPCRDAVRPAPSFTQALDAWRAGAHDEALACCTRLLVTDPAHADALHLAGVIHLARDRDTARTLLTRALAVREDPNILVSLALACDAAGPAQGQALLERALELEPKCPHALNNLANLRAANGDVVQALALLERLLAVQPGNALAQYNYGSLMLMNGAAARAQTALRRAVELDPSHVNSWANLASALIALKAMLNKSTAHDSRAL